MVIGLSACGEETVSSTVSSTVNSDVITITPSVPSTADNIAANDPSNSETHTLTDEGNEVDRTTNQLLDAAQFVQDTGILALSVRDNKFNTEISTTSLSMEYYCRTVQMKKAFLSREELSRADFNKVLKDCYGVVADAQVYQLSGIVSFANDTYTVEEFSLPMMWGLGFDSAEVLGNGYVRYVGTLTYSADGTEKNEKEYKVSCLVKHTKESSEGFNLLSYKIEK